MSYLKKFISSKTLIFCLGLLPFTNNYASSLKQHLVQRGDTLSKISRNYCGDLNDYIRIANLNDISYPYLIYVGDKIDLPNNCTNSNSNFTDLKNETSNSSKYRVKKGDSLSKIARKFSGVSWRDIYNSNKDIIGNNPNTIDLGMILKIPTNKKFSLKNKNLENKITEDYSDAKSYLATLGGDVVDSLTLHLGRENRIRGTRRLAELTGINPGKCFAKGKKALDNIRNDVEHIIDAANKYGLDKSNMGIIAAIEYHETGGENFCLSNANSAGKMGLSHWFYSPKNEVNGEVWHPIKPFDPKENIHRGTQAYAYLFERYKSQNLALLAYNQGESVVDSAINLLRANGLKASYNNVKNLKVVVKKRTLPQLENEMRASRVSNNRHKIRVAIDNFRKAKRELKNDRESFVNIPYLDNNYGNYYISSEGRNYAKNIYSGKNILRKSEII